MLDHRAEYKIADYADVKERGDASVGGASIDVPVFGVFNRG
jgi:hypothetical protein